MSKRRYIKKELFHRWLGWEIFFEGIIYVIAGLFQKFMDMSPEMADYRDKWYESQDLEPIPSSDFFG